MRAPAKNDVLRGAQTLCVPWPDWIRFGSHDDVPEPERTREQVAQELQLERGEIDELASVFVSPRWLSDLGRSSWYLVGFLLLVGGVMWLLAATYTIVGPLVVAIVIATVTVPLVSRMQRHRVPRAAGAAIVLVAIIAAAALVLVAVLAGIRDESGAISETASHAAAKAEHWLKGVGVNSGSAAAAKANLSTTAPEIVKTLSGGIVEGIRGIASVMFALSLLFLSAFFLLKDGPRMRATVDRHLGVPGHVAQTISGGVIRSLRGYFKGVTLVAAFNGIVIALGALALGLPLVATIGVVNFILAYIPFIGAFAGGAFAVVIALGAKGTTAALIMLVIVILANGLLQNIVSPFAMGSALELNPLVVLVVTIGSGCLFGTIGLILSAPLVSAAVHIKQELDHARAVAALRGGGAPAADP